MVEAPRKGPPNGPFVFDERAKALAKHLQGMFGPSGMDDFTVRMTCESFIAAAERDTLLQYLCDVYPCYDNLTRMEIINATQKAMREGNQKANPS